MGWNAPDATLEAIHPDWLELIARRFGGGELWRRMRSDPVLRPHLLAHIMTAFFGEAPEAPSEVEDGARVDRAIGREGATLVRLAGWLWYAPVLLPPLISGGVVPGLSPPSANLLRALPGWHDRPANGMEMPSSDASLDAAGAECRLIWIDQAPGAIAIRAMLQLPAPRGSADLVVDDDLACRVFEAALAIGPDK